MMSTTKNTSSSLNPKTETTEVVLVSREGLLGKPKKRRHSEATVEGFGTFRIQNLTAAEQNTLNRKNFNSKGVQLPNEILKANARLIIACIVDEDGDRVFVDADIKELLDLDAAILDEVIGEVADHCGLNDDAAKN